MMARLEKKISSPKKANLRKTFLEAWDHIVFGKKRLLARTLFSSAERHDTAPWGRLMTQYTALVEFSRLKSQCRDFVAMKDIALRSPYKHFILAQHLAQTFAETLHEGFELGSVSERVKRVASCLGLQRQKELRAQLYEVVATAGPPSEEEAMQEAIKYAPYEQRVLRAMQRIGIPTLQAKPS
jgi:hypothetical protein